MKMIGNKICDRRQRRSAMVWPPVFICAAILLLCGCAERRTNAKSFPWNNAAAIRPRPPETIAAENPAAPSLSLDISKLPATIITPRRTPARPHVATISPAPSAEPVQPDPLPNRSATERRRTFRRKTGNRSGCADCRTQLEIRGGQIIEFGANRSGVESARLCGRSSPGRPRRGLSRARLAAKKAQVLSEQLAASL